MQARARDEEQKVDYSLLDDTFSILNKLEQDAKKVEFVADLGKRLYQGRTDEEEKNYTIAYSVTLHLNESGLTHGRFYAASELIDHAMSIYWDAEIQPILINLPINETLREFKIMTGTEQMEARACGYDNFNITVEGKKVAPISLFPFPTIKHHVSEILKDSFTDWEINPDNPTQFKRTFSKYTDVGSQFQCIQACCKELDKKFNFEMRSYFHGDFVTFFISKDKLEQASKLLGYPCRLFAKKDENEKPADGIQARPPGGPALG